MRIIPARAGFTQRRGNRPRNWWDHPRSRGVYSRSRGRIWPPTGSSPLARGLHHFPWRASQQPWIIPARAGFTMIPGRPKNATPDHPRSRGVYPRLDRPLLERDGSSPLARGLHYETMTDAERARIIPARAGFTRGPPGPGRLEGDHPRSRGVYGRPPPAGPPPRGSSPLARGLRE